MVVKTCLLCEGSITTEKRELCDNCMAMAQRLDFLIMNHREAALQFIANTYNEANDEQSKRFDRRKTPYTPPPGIHTPDRRKKIRRRARKEVPRKRRRSDQ